MRAVAEAVTRSPVPARDFDISPEPWSKSHNIEALIITYTVLGVPYYYDYRRIYPKTLF